VGRELVEAFAYVAAPHPNLLPVKNGEKGFAAFAACSQFPKGGGLGVSPDWGAGAKALLAPEARSSVQLALREHGGC
jgi:hypothetical protein